MTTLTLLCTLGNSWAVVPEAYLMGNGSERYAEVSVLATSGIDPSVEACREWFAAHAPDVSLRVFVIADLPDIRDAHDHARYEEALFRVFADLWLKRTHEDIHLCLAGGFKTISSAAHQTADLFGCAKLFHITTPSKHPDFDNPRDLFSAIEDKLRKGLIHPALHLIDLGDRPGWPTLQQLLGEAPGLPDTGHPFHITDTRFREKILNRLREANRLAQSEHELASLPFPQIARWSPAARDWLHEPLDPDKDAAWVLSLPKIELHCHLGGFATHGDLLNDVRAAACHPDQLPPHNEPTLPTGWPLPENPVSLQDYMKLGDANGSAVLKDPGCLKRHIELLYEHLLSQNITYAEIRCSPVNYATPGRSPWTVLEEIKQTFDRCMAEAAKVAAAVPGAEPVPASVPLADSRRFIPFEESADYHQTWRDLPHRHQAGATAFVTFRLADSLPADRLASWHREKERFLALHPKPWSESTWNSFRRQFPERLEAWLDEPHGECLLRDPAIAAEVESALHHFDGERYVLDAYVIMPNHVHVLVKPLPDHSLEEILHSWKSFTAHQINKRLGRQGQLWEHESFDHLLRSAAQLERLRKYIGDNPAKAGLGEGTVIGHGIGLVSDGDTPRGTPDATGSSSQRLDATSGSASTCHVNLLVIGTRRKEGDHRTTILKHLMHAITADEHWRDDSNCRVVGVDLAGFEDRETRAHYYREDFRMVHRAGLALTVHAGENDDSEGIWSAVFDLNTRRLGHALSLGESPELLRSVADRRIGVEMCPYANYQIKGFPLFRNASETLEPTLPASGTLAATSTATYPLLRYLRAGVPVTINTDNIGISAASLTDNILLLPRLCPGITRLEILQLIRNAVDQAFLSPAARQHLLGHLHLPHIP